MLGALPAFCSLSCSDPWWRGRVAGAAAASGAITVRTVALHPAGATPLAVAAISPTAGNGSFQLQLAYDLSPLLALEKLRTLELAGVAFAAPQLLPPSLRHLKVFASSTVPLHAQHLADAISHLPLLEHLELTQQQLWEPSGAQGAENERPRWDAWLQLVRLHTVHLDWSDSICPPDGHEQLADPNSYAALICDAQIDVLRGLPALTHLDTGSMGFAHSTDFLGRLCRAPHSLQLREFSCKKLYAVDLRALAAVPTLTTLQPTWLMLEPADLQPEGLLPLPQLRALWWDASRSVLTAAQSLEAFAMLGLSGLTALRLLDKRLSDEQLALLLSPLTQLEELKLLIFNVHSAAFLLSGSLPRTLRTLCLWSGISAAALEHALPALTALTSLVVRHWLGWDSPSVLLISRLRVPSELLPQLRSFSDRKIDWYRSVLPTSPSPFSFP